MAEKELVLFESEYKSVSLSVPFENETVWLNQSQMTQLFSVDRTVITKHVNNVFTEPFKMWLAEVGRERIEETIDPV